MERQLKEKLLDYMRFSKILFYLSIFFFCGIIFTGHEKTADQNFVFMFTAVAFISLSFALFYKSRKIQAQLDEI